MADLDFFFDPGCPWAWITSRWVSEVRKQRNYEVSWKFISLAMVNDDIGYAEGSERYQLIHKANLAALRVASVARALAGNDGVDKFYTAIGTTLYVEKNRGDFDTNPHGFLSSVLNRHSLPIAWADAFDDETHTPIIRYETDMALSRTGKFVGTPILTFHPGTSNEGSFFGPVISKSPRGAEAVKLWDAVETIATTSGMAELKRSLRAAADFT